MTRPKTNLISNTLTLMAALLITSVTFAQTLQVPATHAVLETSVIA